MKQIQKVSKKDKRKKTARYSDKKRVFELPKGTLYNAAHLPVIQNLTALGFPAADIGMILGYAGKDARQFIKNLKKNHLDVAKAIRIGNEMANAALVAKMFQSAIGYDFEEEEIKFESKTKFDDKGKAEVIDVPVEKKKKRKHFAGSPQLAMFLAANRMPQSFVNRLEIHKKDFDLFKETPEEVIKKLAGKLIEYSQTRKKVKSKVIENDANV